MTKNLDNLTRSLDEIDLEKFCFFPFTQMLLQPTGTISACCWNQSLVLGVVPENKMMEAWNSTESRNLRKEFLSGSPKSCEMQMRHIGCHRWSRREENKHASLSEIQTSMPQRLDVRLNGKCNLQCVMCDVWKQPNGVYDKSDFWELGPSKIFPFLKEIDVLGGEPFIQKDTFRLIDQISKVNSDCTWAFVTNGSYTFTTSIKDRLDQISIRWLQISLDATTIETYQKVSLLGKFEKVVQTIDDFKLYQKQRAEAHREFRLTISMCVQKGNCHEVESFLRFATEKGIDPVLQFAYEPAAVSILQMTSAQRIMLNSQYNNLVEKYGVQILSPITAPIQESLINSDREMLQN